MVRNRDAVNAIHERQKRLALHRRKALLAAMVGVVTVVQAITASLLSRRPQHTSILTGHMLMNEWLRGHPGSFYDALGTTKKVFWKLLVELERYGGLRSTRGVSSVEKLGMWLHHVRTGSTIRAMKNRFQHSADTISRYGLVSV